MTVRSKKPELEIHVKEVTETPQEILEMRKYFG